MVNIECRTNIDCCKYLQWPNELPERPVVGDLIRSTSSTSKKYIELEVVRCTWFYSEHSHDWILNVELWMVIGRYENLTAFEKWVEGRPY